MSVYLCLMICCIYVSWGMCPDGGITDPSTSKCYMFSNSKANWFTAKQICDTKEAILAKIESQTEMDFMQSVKPNEHYWIGMNDLAIEGDYRWADNSPVVWFKWRHDQPNGGSSQNCTAIDSGWTWQDKDCLNEYYFVCNPVAGDGIYIYASNRLDSLSDAGQISSDTSVDRVDCALRCKEATQCSYWGFSIDISSGNCLLYKILLGNSVSTSGSWEYYQIGWIKQENNTIQA